MGIVEAGPAVTLRLDVEVLRTDQRAPTAMEMALMQKRQVNVFQIPPIASAQGHCSADWRGKQIWTGKCQVMHEINKCCKIMLVNEDETLFAQSVITDGSTYDTHITRAYDSSRAFSLVLHSDQG